MPPRKRKTAAAAAEAAGPIFDGLVIGVLTSDATKKAVSDHGGKVLSGVKGKTLTHIVADAGSCELLKRGIEAAAARGVVIVDDAFVTDSVAAGKLVDASKHDPRGDAMDEGADEPEPEAQPKKRAARGKKAAAAAAADNDDEPMPDAEKPAPKRKRGAAAAAAAAAAAEADDDDDADDEPEAKKTKADPADLRKVVKKGRAAVEPESGKSGTHHVLEEGTDVWDCMLNQTDVNFGTFGHNKFYQLQLLCRDGRADYSVFMRWGRVGEPGKSKDVECGGNLAQAKTEFCKKFRDKTKNDWYGRASFTPAKGKYTLIETDYDDTPEPKAAPAPTKTGKGKGKEAAKTPESTLVKPVQEFIKLIFDLKMMEKTVTEMEYDVRKMPLGKLSKAQILKGYKVLKELEGLINNGGSAKAIGEATSEFYTLIPHSFGRKRPPVINTIEGIKNKLDMLQALADIEVATTLLDQSSAEAAAESPIDTHYKKLKADLEHVATGSDDYDIVEKYLKNSWERGTAPKIVDVLKINRDGEDKRFESAKVHGNRRLLWHGSRLSNYVGIISQGLRIAPPEAPVSGYRFGKGIYSADMASLAARYCRSYGQSEFVMIVCDVALGVQNKLARDKYMEKPPKGTHSTLALGRVEPDPKMDKKVLDDVVVPHGKPVPSGHNNVSCHEHQYIVYDTDQVRMRYLVRMRG